MNGQFKVMPLHLQLQVCLSLSSQTNVLLVECNIQGSMLARRPGPRAAKQPQNITLPPLRLTVAC